MPASPDSLPLRTPAYLLTWTAYATWLHGDPRGSADDRHHRPGSPWLAPDPRRADAARRRQVAPAIRLSNPMRQAVERAIDDVATRRDWRLHALSVRTNHVHAVVTAPHHRPEIVMQQLKSWSTRALRAQALLPPSQPVWTKMGSTRWLNHERALAGAIHYVLHQQ